MVTASQSRAARGLLDWTQQELADAARVGVATVRIFEGEAAETRPAILAALRRALELAGVEFIDENGGGVGVRYRKRQRAKRTRQSRTVIRWIYRQERRRSGGAAKKRGVAAVSWFDVLEYCGPACFCSWTKDTTPAAMWCRRNPFQPR